MQLPSGYAGRGERLTPGRDAPGLSDAQRATLIARITRIERAMKNLAGMKNADSTNYEKVRRDEAVQMRYLEHLYRAGMPVAELAKVQRDMRTMREQDLIAYSGLYREDGRGGTTGIRTMAYQHGHNLPGYLDFRDKGLAEGKVSGLNTGPLPTLARTLRNLHAFDGADRYRFNGDPAEQSRLESAARNLLGLAAYALPGMRTSALPRTAPSAAASEPAALAAAEARSAGGAAGPVGGKLRLNDPASGMPLATAKGAGALRTYTINGQAPRWVWKENAGGQVRTIEEATEIARRHGVNIPSDVKFFPNNELTGTLKGKFAEEGNYTARIAASKKRRRVCLLGRSFKNEGQTDTYQYQSRSSEE